MAKLKVVDHRALGFSIVAGVDEVGRGCLAGPVLSGAVILRPEFRHKEITDSKLLTPQKRHELALLIKEKALAWAIGMATVEEIERFNIFRASLLSMRRAVEALSIEPELITVDGKFPIDGVTVKQMPLVKGDLRCLPISCASIIAKVTRDALMEELEEKFPGYELSKHKGYATPRHRELIKTLGPTVIHRRTFDGVKEHLQK